MGPGATRPSSSRGQLRVQVKAQVYEAHRRVTDPQIYIQPVRDQTEDSPSQSDLVQMSIMRADALIEMELQRRLVSKGMVLKAEPLTDRWTDTDECAVTVWPLISIRARASPHRLLTPPFPASTTFQR